MFDTLIEWRDFYSVGSQDLDAQHRTIIEIINDLYTAMQVGAPEESKKHFVDRLVWYTQSHFSYEEHIMEFYGFPDMVEHRGLHNEIAHYTFQLRRCYRDVSFSEMLRFLKDWWANHICGEDKRYSPYIKRGQAARSSRESETASRLSLCKAARR